LIAKASEALDTAARTELYKEFQKKVAADLPLINVAEWSFISVIRDTVGNVANNPRWAVSNWADTWLEG
ncbi:MAG: ABC transporter substrate-binding protein, partial [Mesorhizobium sp.]